MKILVLGATGMLGNIICRYFHDSGIETWGTMRNEKARTYFPDSLQNHLLANVDVINHDQLIDVFERIRPDFVINCIGIIKQVASAKDPLVALPINSLLPHRLARLCHLIKARLIHISTDCVFSGNKGCYTESDSADAEDLYGMSKYLGEIHNLQHVVTLRTSIIGHELNSNYGLVEWFLSQNKPIKGYQRAIFSGLPTIEFARVIKDYVFTNEELFGLYQVAAKPINKYDLLKLIAETYGKEITIEPDQQLAIDRSLSGKLFTEKTGYQAPEWPQLIDRMFQSKKYIGVR